MGLHDRNRPAWGGDGAWSGPGLEPIRIPALTLVDAFEAFDPWQGQISPYPWAPLQRPQPAIGGTAEPVPPDDPEGLNALAARARQMLGDLPADPAELARTLDAALVTPDVLGDPDLPTVGDGGLARQFLERADPLDGPGDTTPTAEQWLAVLALALLGKAEQLIREIDRDSERVFTADPAVSEFFENEFNRIRLNWFRRLAAECVQAVAAAETNCRTVQRGKRNRKANSQRANNRRHAARRELMRMVESIYCNEYQGRGVSDKQIAREIWPRIESYNLLSDNRRAIQASEPWITPLPIWISKLKDRYGERSRSED